MNLELQLSLHRACNESWSFIYILGWRHSRHTHPNKFVDLFIIRWIARDESDVIAWPPVTTGNELLYSG